MALTRRQREVLEVIRGFIARNGYSPSLEEIGGALGLSSVATVHKHVTLLVAKGYVRRVWNQNRSIELVETKEGAESVLVPIRGSLTAGAPLVLVQPEAMQRVPADLAPERSAVFALRVVGPGLERHQIRDRDLLVLEERPTVRDGETVVAIIDGVEATVGTFFRQGDSVHLGGPAPGDDPMVLSPDRLAVVGVVAGLVRRYPS